MIHEAAYDHIRSETIRIEEVATKRGGEHWQAFSRDLQAQTAFLEIFRKTFSVKLALKATDTAHHTYNKWRATSISFVESFNEINEMWADDLLVSAATRAKGRLILDSSTESGFVEDAEGTPLYMDADNQLTKSFLRVMYPEQFNEKVDMNLKGGLNNTTTPLDKEAYAALRKEMLKSDDC